MHSGRAAEAAGQPTDLLPSALHPVTSVCHCKCKQLRSFASYLPGRPSSTSLPRRLAVSWRPPFLSLALLTSLFSPRLSF